MAFLAAIKEFIRKKIVHLKRKPETLPFLAIIISCMVYTFNLSTFSMAAIYCNDYYVAILVFVITLMSFLSIFTYMNSHDKKGVRMPMIILSVVQLVALFVCDALCYKVLHRDAIAETERVQLAEAASKSVTHMVWLVISILLIVLKPLYAKALNLINTTIKDDEFAGEKETSDEVIATDEE